jgi:hypothetical protein
LVYFSKLLEVFGRIDLKLNFLFFKMVTSSNSYHKSIQENASGCWCQVGWQTAFHCIEYLFILDFARIFPGGIIITDCNWYCCCNSGWPLIWLCSCRVRAPPAGGAGFGLNSRCFHNCPANFQSWSWHTGWIQKTFFITFCRHKK